MCPGTSRSTRGWGSWRFPARHYVPSWQLSYAKRRIEAWILIREQSWGINAGRLAFVDDVLRPRSGGRILWLVSIEALASRVGRDFEAVSAQSHAAPASCS